MPSRSGCKVVAGDLLFLLLISIKAHMWGLCAVKDKEGRDKNCGFSGSVTPAHKLEICFFHVSSSSSQHSNPAILHLKGKLGDKSEMRPAFV